MGHVKWKWCRKRTSLLEVPWGVHIRMLIVPEPILVDSEHPVLGIFVKGAAMDMIDKIVLSVAYIRNPVSRLPYTDKSV